MKYKVNVEELLSRIVEVEAENEEEAEEKVREMLYERLNVLSILPKEVLIKNRYKKYRVM